VRCERSAAKSLAYTKTPPFGSKSLTKNAQAEALEAQQSLWNIPAATQKSISLPERGYLKGIGSGIGLTAPPTLFYDLHFI
jgi:hypothetical protein